MNAIKAQWARIQGQLALLTPSQRLLAVSLVAILVLTVLYWGKYAATADRVAISARPLSAAQTQQVLDQLKGMNVDASVSNGFVMVPPDAEMKAIGLLAYEPSYGVDATEAVDRLMSKATLWDSAAKTAKLENQRKELVLGMMIRSWPGVEAATVIIDPSEKRSLSGVGTEPRATIAIQMKDKTASPVKVVQAAAAAVAGANAGLPIGNIAVTVNGMRQRVDDPSDQMAMGMGTYMEWKQKQEADAERKVLELLKNIPNVLVRVSVEVNTVSSTEEKTVLDPKNIIHKEIETTEKTTESNTTPAGGGDPGVASNTGATVPGAAGTGGGASQTNSTSENQSRFALSWGQSHINSSKPAGEGVVKGVAVRIPKSYLVRLAKAEAALHGKKDADPDEAALEKAKEGEVKTIVEMVASATDIADKGRVVVSDYLELEPEATPQAASTMPVMTLVSGYGKEVVLGVLALAAMAMVSGIVKKSGAGVPAAVSAAAALGAAVKEVGPGGIDRLAGGHEVVGAATEGGGALEAMELDEETSQTQQMVSQVSTMVKENPDAATALIKRWMARE